MSDAPTLSLPSSVDVVIPTYRRPEPLARCLTGVANQTRLPDRVLVVAREDDDAARVVIERFADRILRLELVLVATPGVVAAMSAGVARSSGEVIAFTDDDAVPRPDWLEGILEHLSNAAVGAVGGRDVIKGQEDPLSEDVGRFRRSGRLTGMHHLGVGAARDVHVLKGVNMAFRAEALAFPKRGVLRGSGAEVDFEIITCAWARDHGWRIVYDPALLVDHHVAVRHGLDRRDEPASSAVYDAAFNSVVAASALGATALVRHAGYGVIVGTADRPGVVRATAAVIRGEREVVRRAVPALQGRMIAFTRAFAQILTARRRLTVTAGELRAAVSKRPRVALVAHDVHDDGGMERAAAELVRALRDHYDFTIVSSRLADDLRPFVTWRRVSAPRRPFIAKYASFFVRAGLQLLRTDGIVHTVGAIVPNRADVASVHFCHAGYRAAAGSFAPTGPLLRRINTGIARAGSLMTERWCYRPTRVRAFAAVSDGVGRELETYYPGIPVTVTPNGVDSERFRPDAASRDATRAREGVRPDGCVALFVGGDWDRKGMALAVEAAGKARASGVDLSLWVVGPGDEARFAALARGLGIGDAVSFFGQRADTERFYQAADLLVLPSTYETFSMVSFEAAACGLPLVVTRVSGASALVGDDEAGIIVELDSADIARAMEGLANDARRRSDLGAEARRRAACFTWAHSASAVAELYCALGSQDVGARR